MKKNMVVKLRSLIFQFKSFDLSRPVVSDLLGARSGQMEGLDCGPLHRPRDRKR